MNKGKLLSGLVAFAIYLGLIFLVLYFYNIRQTKAKNYVEKNSNRVTVTLVNSDKTVFNRSSKESNHIKSIPKIIPPIHIKRETKKVVPKKHTVKKHIVKKHTPKKVVPKKVVPKKHTVKKHIVKKHTPKKVVPKKVVPKKTAKDLFSSIKTKDVTREPRTIKRHIVVPKIPSRVRHNSSITDRIKNTHQSGRVSNRNSDSGVKNAYIAKVKRHMNNWNANSAYRGKRVSLKLTIYNSGKFSYKIISGADGAMRASLSQFLDRLNRMGQLSRHSKSTPYSIRVDFTVR